MKSQQFETLLAVEGMSCPSCIRHINQALKQVEGVADVEVKLREGRVLVRHQGNVAVGGMVEALEEAGYSSSLASR